MDCRIGDLTIGQVPRVAGTISHRHTLEEGPSGLIKLCNLVEVRLDEIGIYGPNWMSDCQVFEDAGLPVIVTMRLQAEGGKWTEADRARAPMMESALARISTIDIEFRSALCESLCSLAEEKDKYLIVSYHDFNGTPALSELQDVLFQIAQHPHALPKISTMVNTKDDIDVLKHLLDTKIHAPFCVIGMGSKGTRTRTAFPLLGSCLTYGYIDKPSAPGQLPSHQLVQHMRELVPEYNEDFIITKEVLEFV